MPSKKKNVEAYKTELQEFRKLAKRADQRLVALEKMQREEGFENILSWGYRRAMRDIKHWSGEGVKRFNRDVPKNLNSLRAKRRDVEDFLNYVTSTKTGVKSVFVRRANTINSRYGTNFTWEQLGNVFDDKERNPLYEKIGGKTYLKAVAYLNQNEKSIMKQLMSGDKVTVRTGNRKANQAVRELLDNYGIQFNELY